MERTCDATVPMPKTIYILVDGNRGGKENVAPGHGTAPSVTERWSKQT